MSKLAKLTLAKSKKIIAAVQHPMTTRNRAPSCVLDDLPPNATFAEIDATMYAYLDSSALEMNVRRRSSPKKRRREFTLQDHINGGEK